jgi:hypothetical protein
MKSAKFSSTSDRFRIDIVIDSLNYPQYGPGTMSELHPVRPRYGPLSLNLRPRARRSIPDRGSSAHVTLQRRVVPSVTPFWNLLRLCLRPDDLPAFPVRRSSVSSTHSVPLLCAWRGSRTFKAATQVGPPLRGAFSMGSGVTHHDARAPPPDPQHRPQR